MSSVLVTGAGGAAGVAVIRELMTSDHRVVAADTDPLASGSLVAPERVIVPCANDPGFARAVVDAVVELDIDAVVVTVSEEMPALAEVDLGPAAVWLSPADAVRACIDKWRFFEVAQRGGLPVPATVLGDHDDGAGSSIAGPWVVKPRFGRGSRDVHLVDDPQDLASACRRTPDPIVQTRCAGCEFTADVLVDRDGSVAGCVPRWRLETRSGISTKGVTFDDERVLEAATQAVGVLGVQGAVNVQGFVDDRSDEPVQIVEVNPRFSGGLPLSLAAGADLVCEFLRGTFGLPIRPERLRARAGVAMARHFTEVFVSEVCT